MSKKTSETRLDDSPEITQKDIDRPVKRKGLKKKPAKPADVFFVKPEKTGIHLSKAENPFDVLAEHALYQYERNNCVEIREFVRKNKIKVSR